MKKAKRKSNNVIKERLRHFLDMVVAGAIGATITIFFQIGQGKPIIFNLLFCFLIIGYALLIYALSYSREILSFLIKKFKKRQKL